MTTSAPSGAPRNKIDPPPLDAARALAIRDILRSGLPWLLTDEQVAHMLGTTPRAVRRLRENKKIPYVRVGGRFARINLADVMAYVESRRIPAATKTTE